MSKVTLISHIYNEEYLLPSWLEHHKNMVDEIVIVDYNSTDSSLEICKRYNCKILQSKNEMFQADLITRTKSNKIQLKISVFTFGLKRRSTSSSATCPDG
jgi:glycosyltransferase involved in cell wall biosynthesis